MNVLLVVLAVLAVVFLAVNFAAGERKVEHEIEHLYGAEEPQFLRSMGLLVGPSILDGNSVRTLVNGDEIFPAMLAAIRNAQHSILFESYIYWSGEIGEEFAKALAERARAGVKAHVLVDWVGSARMENRLEQQMRDAGVEVEKYHPLRWYNLGRLNNRTHRKLLIVDGRVGFTGGVGIAQEWTGHGQDPDHWRDSHFCVEGPVVAQMQSVMLDNWVKTKGQVLHGARYFPALHEAGKQKAQMFSSSPSGGSESMLMMYLLSITAARKTIDLSSAYFVPEGIARRALVAAAKRGVRVRIIVPGKHIDTETVRRASRGLWGELLEADIQIHEYQPTMYHCKVMIVDGFMTSVGSTNFDVRSFRLNDEANLNVYDAEFAAHQTRIFEEDLKNARRITLQEWKKRPLRERVHERAVALLRIAL